MENVSNLIPFTTFGILKSMKSAGGKPTTFPTLKEFITWARFTSGDSFATESETKTLLEVREHGFEVVKGYITSGVVWIGDLNADECSDCNACVICGHQIPPARFGSNLCSGDCRATKTQRAVVERTEVHDDPNGELVRCDECNDLVALFTRGKGYDRFVACANRKCSEYMLTIHRSNAIAIQDDGSGNQVLANGTVLR